ncbi:hypothetical protein [Salinibacillus xinjiangensis]|uniref:Uncharacterized protein n=1 Tax=Salinibacillus xinjiangensis TaxID=1229268 RepID=A0A6G1X7N9_9BACI|nr:hypothetical protein [Salinibacillus xinjiangensis]MRG86984.1 hypothetical protein [Salinibacillus xinjiangensis]
MAIISKVRHSDKYKCVKLCIQKEKEGFECVKPIERKYSFQKQFRRDGKFFDYQTTSLDSYYEAIYRKG